MNYEHYKIFYTVGKHKPAGCDPRDSQHRSGTWLSAVYPK